MDQVSDYIQVKKMNQMNSTAGTLSGQVSNYNDAMKIASVAQLQVISYKHN